MYHVQCNFITVSCGNDTKTDGTTTTTSTTTFTITTTSTTTTTTITTTTTTTISNYYQGGMIDGTLSFHSSLQQS